MLDVAYVGWARSRAGSMMPEDREEKELRRIEAYQKELETDPQSYAFVALAEAHNRLGQWEQAVDVASKGLEHHPDSVAGHLAFAVAEAGRNRIREALEQIKSALIIDQENPRALALMGSLLLQKGLANRAIQFLTQAVKLAPESREYADLLKRARRIAKTERSVELPEVRGSQIQQTNSPWNSNEGEEATEYLPSDQERTVFAADAKPFQEEGDPTRFDGRRPDKGKRGSELPPPRRVGDEGMDSLSGDQAATTFDRGAVDLQKPKMGGSAAEYSQMMKRLARDDGGPEPQLLDEHATVAEVKRGALESAAGMQSRGASDVAEKQTVHLREVDKSESASKAAPEKPASKKEARPASEKAKPSSGAKDKPKAEAKPKPEPKKEKKPAPAPKEPPMPSDERPATMMVDEAIWAIYGGAPPGQKSPVADATEEAPKRKKQVEESSQDAPDRPQAVMVVRTSEKLGTLAWWTAITVLSGAAAWAGYTVAGRQAGADVSDVSEEVRSVASDLERGGLASLRVAEDALTDLRQMSPDLDLLLQGALADVHARMWRDFGRDPKKLEEARGELAATRAIDPTIEVLSAKVALSTSAVSRELLSKAIDRALAADAKSSKAWVLEARLAGERGDSRQATEALYEAYRINPRRRETLLELARWHASQGATAAAFHYFDELAEVVDNDIEATLERYVLGIITGADPNANDTASQLAGLIREELKEVAKDEAGRAALVFAVSDFVRGDREAGLEHLSLAGAAFDNSPEFKQAVGACLLAAGEFELAKAQLSTARDVESSADSLLWAARIDFALRAKLEPPDNAGERLKKRQKDSTSQSEVKLSFGTIRFTLDRFALVEIAPDASIFPEDEYGHRVRTENGKALERSLQVANLLALSNLRARANEQDEAIELLEEARKIRDEPEIAVALGYSLLGKKEYKAAQRAFKSALDDPKSSAAARIGIAQVYSAQDETLAAIEALEPVIDSGLVAPKAFKMMARLRSGRGDDKGALDLLARAEKFGLSDADAEFQTLRGRLEHRSGNFEQASRAYAKALALDPRLAGDPVKDDRRTTIDLVYVGEALLKKGEDKQAAHLLAAAVKDEDAPNRTRFYLGKALLQRSKTKKKGKKMLEAYLKSAKEADLKAEASKLLKGR